VTGVALLDYGAGNLASVQFAFERLGARVHRVSDAGAIDAAERLVLPGVGAAAWAMGRLDALGLSDPIRAFPRPLIGLCLGQQLLFESSAEGDVPMLGLIPGQVIPLTPGPGLTVPHMGWSALSDLADDPLTEGVEDGAYVYFVHGFACPDGPATLARARHGTPFPAMVRQGNRWGCQFHPERSSTTGARILSNFLAIDA